MGWKAHGIVSCLEGCVLEAFDDDISLVASIVGYQSGRADEGLPHNLSSKLLLRVLEAVCILWDKFRQMQERSAAAWQEICNRGF